MLRCIRTTSTTRHARSVDACHHLITDSRCVAQWLALQRIASRHCDLRLVTFACEGWCGGTGDRNKGFVTTVMVRTSRVCACGEAFTVFAPQLALLTHSQFASRWIHPVDVEEFFAFRTTAATVPPVVLRATQTSESARIFAQYEKRFATTGGKRDDNAMDGRHVLTGVYDLNMFLARVHHYVLHHNHPSWSAMVENPYLAPVARLYGLEGASWPRMFMLLNRWFFTVSRFCFDVTSPMPTHGCARAGHAADAEKGSGSGAGANACWTAPNRCADSHGLVAVGRRHNAFAHDGGMLCRRGRRHVSQR